MDLSTLVRMSYFVAAGLGYEARQKSVHGKIRNLAIPAEPVKSLHRRVLDFLWPLSLQLHPACHGYTPDHSPVTNAGPHCGARWVQRLDIEDFFPSTRPSAISNALIQCGATEEVAALLTTLSVHDGSLPMGAPCSPLLSNLILSPADAQIASSASLLGVTYTRYADDMTFSADLEFDMAEAVQESLEAIGYRLNADKSRLRRKGQSIAVTGLRVSEPDHPRLPKQFKRRLRQELYFIERFGLEEHCLSRYRWPWIEEEDDERQLAQSVKHIQGKLRYAGGVEPEWMKVLLEANPHAASRLMPSRGQQVGRRLVALASLAAEIRSRPHVALSRQPTPIGAASLPSAASDPLGHGIV